jgi:hypothetical protein
MDKTHRSLEHAARNRGRMVGQKPPLRIRDVWAAQSRLELAIPRWDSPLDERVVIRGGPKLVGEVAISAARNAALPMMILMPCVRSTRREQ